MGYVTSLLSFVKVYVPDVVFVPSVAVRTTVYFVPIASPAPIVKVVSFVYVTAAPPLMLYVPFVALSRPTVISID